MTLFERIQKAGIPFDNHESDLLVFDCDELWAILDDFPVYEKNTSQFVDTETGDHWVEIPFAYTPWWDEHMKLKRVD